MKNFIINDKKHVLESKYEEGRRFWKQEHGYRDFTADDLKALLDERDHLRDFLAESTKERDNYKKALKMLILEDDPRIPCVSSCNLNGKGVCGSSECIQLHLDNAGEKKE